MTEQVRDAREFKQRLADYGNLWTDVRLRGVIGRVRDRWVLLALHADLTHESVGRTVDVSDANIPNSVRLLEEIRPFRDLNAVLDGIEGGEVNLGGERVVVRGFKGGRTILVRGHGEHHLVPSDIAARWIQPWPSLVFSLGASTLKDLGFDEETVDRELAGGDFDHDYLFELTRDALGFEVGSAWGPNIHVVAPIPVALFSEISPQKVSLVVKAHEAVGPGDIRVRIAEGRDSARFRRSVSCENMDTSCGDGWCSYAQNHARPIDTNGVALRLIFKEEQIDRDYQSLERTGPQYLVQPWQNIKFADAELGMVELRYPPWGDFQWIMGHLEEANPRVFTCRVLAHQLVKPDLTEETLGDLSDDKLSAIAQNFVRGVEELRRKFKRHKDKPYFSDFQELFRRHLAIYAELAHRLQEQMQSAFGNNMARLAHSFSVGPWRRIAEDIARQRKQLRQLILPASQLTVLNQVARDIVGPAAMVQDVIRLTQMPSIRFPDIVGPPPRLPDPSNVGEEQELEEDLLDRLLQDVDPELINVRRGAWDAFRSGSTEAIRQAFHSMRELVRELLERIAPDEQILQAPWYRRPQTPNTQVTRRQRVRFALVGADPANPHSRIQSLANWLELIEHSVDDAYGQLSSGAHGQRPPAAEYYLRITEHFLVILPCNRVELQEQASVDK